jgi:hypothetical protein
VRQRLGRRIDAAQLSLWKALDQPPQKPPFAAADVHDSLASQGLGPAEYGLPSTVGRRNVSGKTASIIIASGFNLATNAFQE